MDEISTSAAEAGDVTGEAGDAELLDTGLHGESDADGEIATEGGEAEGEGESAAEGGEDGGATKLTAKERIQQLIEERNADREKLSATEARLAELETKFTDAESARENPAFVEVDFGRLNQHIADTEAKIDELRAEGDHFEAKRLEKGLYALIADVEVNEQKKKAAADKKEGATTERERVGAMVEQLNRAATFFREQQKIPQDTWDRLSEAFTLKMKGDPLVAAEFREKIERQGPIAAVSWVYRTISEEVKQAGQQNAAAKKKVSGLGGGGGVTAADGVTTWEQLQKLSSKQINEFAKRNPKRFNTLFNSRMKAA